MAVSLFDWAEAYINEIDPLSAATSVPDLLVGSTSRETAVHSPTARRRG
jgi:hypothetical protein